MTDEKVVSVLHESSLVLTLRSLLRIALSSFKPVKLDQTGFSLFIFVFLIPLGTFFVVQLVTPGSDHHWLVKRRSPF